MIIQKTQCSKQILFFNSFKKKMSIIILGNKTEFIFEIRKDGIDFTKEESNGLESEIHYNR